MVDYRKILQNKQGEANRIDKNVAHYKSALDILTEQKLHLEEAQAILILVAQATMEELKFHIENLVTLALSSVFDDPYEFEAEFVQRRNQTEVDLFFVRDGERISPLSASGGGTVDVASFALRVSLWSLQQKKTRPVFILDEPFSRISSVYQQKASEMMKAVSEKLGLQIIAITHNETLTEAADKVIKVGIKRGVSYIDFTGGRTWGRQAEEEHLNSAKPLPLNESKNA